MLPTEPQHGRSLDLIPPGASVCKSKQPGEPPIRSAAARDIK